MAVVEMVGLLASRSLSSEPRTSYSPAENSLCEFVPILLLASMSSSTSTAAFIAVTLQYRLGAFDFLSYPSTLRPLFLWAQRRHHRRTSRPPLGAQVHTSSRRCEKGDDFWTEQRGQDGGLFDCGGVRDAEEGMEGEVLLEEIMASSPSSVP